MSYAKTAMLMSVMTAVFMAAGFAIAGETGMWISFAIALVMNLYSYWNSDKIALRMHKAIEVDRTSAPELYDIMEQLVANADMPMPRVYVIHTEQPNAFATGRNPQNAAVAATTGLLDRLSKEEIAGVMAHELAHIKNRDTLIMTITATFASALTMLAYVRYMPIGRDRNGGLGMIGMLAASILAPLAATIVQMAISRTREYQADKVGAEICTQPLWLASALEKISASVHDLPMQQAESHPAAAHMFIINPLSGRRIDNLFSTHPNTDNRIQALEELAHEWGQAEAYGAVGQTSGEGEPDNPWS